MEDKHQEKQLSEADRISNQHLKQQVEIHKKLADNRNTSLQAVVFGQFLGKYHLHAKTSQLDVLYANAPRWWWIEIDSRELVQCWVARDDYISAFRTILEYNTSYDCKQAYTLWDRAISQIFFSILSNKKPNGYDEFARLIPRDIRNQKNVADAIIGKFAHHSQRKNQNKMQTGTLEGFSREHIQVVVKIFAMYSACRLVSSSARIWQIVQERKWFQLAFNVVST